MPNNNKQQDTDWQDYTPPSTTASKDDGGWQDYTPQDTAAPKPEEPGFLQRMQQGYTNVTLGTKHPVDTAIDTAKAYKEHPFKTFWQGTEDLARPAYNLVHHPIDTVTGLTGGNAFAEDLNNKNYAGAIGDVAGGVTNAFMLKKPAEPVADLAAKGFNSVGDAYTGFREPSRLAAADKQLSRVQKPTINNTEYAARQKAALPDLQQIAQKHSGEITSPRDAVDAIDEHIEELNKPVMQAAQAVQGPEWGFKRIPIKGDLMKAANDALSKNQGGWTAEDVENALKEVGSRSKPHNPEGWSAFELENLRKTLNENVQKFYKASSEGQVKSIKTDAEAVAMRAVADKARDILYGDEVNPGVLEEKAGIKGDPRALRQRVGNLVAVRNNLERSITRAEHTGDWSAFEQLGKRNPGGTAFGVAAGSILGGFSGLPGGSIAGAAIGGGANALWDYHFSKNPNLNITKAFGNLENTRRPNLPTVTAPENPPGVPSNAQMSFPNHGPLFETFPSQYHRPEVPAPITGEQQPFDFFHGSLGNIYPTEYHRPTTPAPITGTQLPLNFLHGELGAVNPSQYHPPTNPPAITGEQQELPFWQKPLGEIWPTKKPRKK